MAITTPFKQPCPSCEAPVPIRDAGLIGKKVECPKCKYRFVVEEPADRPTKVRACLEALAYLLARAVREHQAAGQTVTRITVSGGMARSALMCQILASAVNRPLERLVSDEGPASRGAFLDLMLAV